MDTPPIPPAAGGPGGEPFVRFATRAALIVAVALAATDAVGEDETPMTARDLTPEMIASFTVPDPERELPFMPGERLTFLIGWSIFDVGEAVLSVEESTVGDEAALLFTLEVQTNAFADRIYRVRNRTRSWMDTRVTTTLHYHNEQSEGRRERDIEYDFDWEESTVRYRNHADENNPGYHDPIEVVHGTFDPMGITYFVRTLPFDVGDRIVVPTTNGRELFITEIEVAERTKRNFRLGRQSALVLHPDIQDVGGVFQRSSDASVTFYMSDDERRLPLRMESSVTVGRFWAELVRVERPGEAVEEEEPAPRTRRRRGR